MHRILIVVDCQKDFIDGTLGFDGAKNIIPGIIERIESYRQPATRSFILSIHTARIIWIRRKEDTFPLCTASKEAAGLSLTTR